MIVLVSCDSECCTRSPEGHYQLPHSRGTTRYYGENSGHKLYDSCVILPFTGPERLSTIDTYIFIDIDIIIVLPWPFQYYSREGSLLSVSNSHFHHHSSYGRLFSRLSIYLDAKKLIIDVKSPHL